MKSITAFRIADLLEAGCEFVRARRGVELVVLAGSMDAAHDLVRLACDAAILGAHRLTLPLLARTLAERAMHEQSLAPLTVTAAEAIAARVVSIARAEKRLEYFREVAARPGFAVALARTLAELAAEQIAPAGLERGGPAGRDLALLAARYAQELADRRLVSAAQLYSFAAAEVRAGRHQFCRLPLLLLDLPPDSASERELLQSLTDASPDVLVLALAAEAAGTPSAPSALESLQRNLFAPEPVPDRPADASFTVFSASSEALECVEIARAIHAAAARGVPFDEIAILLRNPEQYQPLVEEALRRAAIPACYSRGVARPEPSGRAFLALLACAREDLSAARFAEYLSLGQAPVPGTAGWERLLNEAAVIGGERRWQRRLRRLEEHYRARLECAGAGDDRAYWHERLERLESLQSYSLPLMRRLAQMPRHTTWTEWLEALYELAQAALREPGPVFEFLDELQPTAGAGDASLEDVLLLMSGRLRSLRTAPAGDRYGHVFVAGINEARGMSFRLIFVPGLCEGSFPKPAFEDPLLLDEARRRISPNLRVSTEEDERGLLRRAAACARDQLVLSYPRIDVVGGRERVPSLYIFEAARAARGHAYDTRGLQEEAAAFARTTLRRPAPADPADAIDLAEYDLAALHAAVDRQQKGGAAYLKEVHPYLAPALRARWRRWSKKWCAADGLVDLDVEALQVLEQHRPARRAYSTSELEEFAVCPYRFALRAIHRLRPLEPAAAIECVDPLTRGSLFHRIVFELLRDLEDAGLLPVARARLEAAFEKLDAAVVRVAAEFAEQCEPVLPQVWSTEIERIRADLRGWLAEKALSEPDWTPLAFELSFGLPAGGAHDPRSVPDPLAVLEGVRLRGSIDLVERHTSGALRVTDHKTGAERAPQPVMVGQGEVLQPVLYALAAGQILGGPVLTGRLSYSTLRANFRTVDLPANAAAQAAAAKVIHVIDESLRTGFLPASPREDACQACDYQAVCGPYEEQRARLKSQPELRPLAQIRRMP
ncbi:MAG: exodeoxyribonuclease V subunit gamma [Acidobacteria bacterium]|nr:exodeoxyribonuclease V subunit gamma [Acidobacteriota bacterium]